MGRIYSKTDTILRYIFYRHINITAMLDTVWSNLLNEK